MVLCHAHIAVCCMLYVAIPLDGVQCIHVPAVLVHGAHAVRRPVPEEPVQGVHLLLKAFVLAPLKKGTLEVFSGIINIFDHVKLNKCILFTGFFHFALYLGVLPD